MKKIAFLFVLLLMLGTVSAMLNVNIAYATHNAEVEVSPEYYDGGAELKNFTVYNLPGSIHGIIEVVITFANISQKDIDEGQDYKPVDYTFPDGWKATYEPALRQVIFESLNADTDIEPGSREFFTINFTKGPDEPGTYEWTVSTTDRNEDAHTYYPTQTIDRDAPVVRIDYPEDGATVIGTWDPYPDRHCLWINVTAYDPEPGSDIKMVEVQVSNATWASDWKDITASKIGDKYYIWWCDLWVGDDGCASYDVTARASDNAGNSATDKNEFEYCVTGVWIEISPDEGTVWRETWIDEEGVYKSEDYTYGEKTLGTEVTVTGGGFTKNSIVNVTVAHPLWGEILVVKNKETDEDGSFTASFVFPTAPQGIYEVSAIDLEGLKPLYSEWFTVLPEIIYKPVIVIGPAIIEAIATGLPGSVGVSGFTCDGTDALLAVNQHVVHYWYTDAQGVLHSHAAGNPGFLMPVLEPGTYEIALWRAYGEGEYTLIVANKLHVVNCLEDLCDILDDLELKLDYITPIIETIDDNVVSILTAVGIIEADLKDIINSIEIIGDNVVEIKTTVGTIFGKVESINWDDIEIIIGKVESIDWDDIENIGENVESIDWDEIDWDDIGAIKAKVLNVNFTGIETDVGFIKKHIPEDIATSLGMNIAAVLSAIAAIAAIISVIVVVRRLKVAA